MEGHEGDSPEYLSHMSQAQEDAELSVPEEELRKMILLVPPALPISPKYLSLPFSSLPPE